KPSHRVTDDVRLLDLEMVQQPHHIQRHFLSILFCIMWFVAFAVTATIECNHPIVFCESLKHSVSNGVGSTPEAMYQDNRLACSLFYISDAYSLRVEELVLQVLSNRQRRHCCRHQQNYSESKSYSHCPPKEVECLEASAAERWS